MDSDVDESHAEATPLDNSSDATVQPQSFHIDTWNDAQTDLLVLDWRIFGKGGETVLRTNNYCRLTVDYTTHTPLLYLELYYDFKSTYPAMWYCISIKLVDLWETD